MQIVKYEVNKNILTIGFREEDFVVYSQIAYDNTKTKIELLQLAYIQVKHDIDYEKTLTEHSIITNETGDEFIPETSKIIKILIDTVNVQNYFSCLEVGNLTQQFTAKLYDQYGDVINKSIIFTLGNTPTNITLNNGLLTIGQVDNDYDLILTASCDDVTDTLLIYIKKYMVPIIPPKTELELIQDTQSQVVLALVTGGLM